MPRFSSIFEVIKFAPALIDVIRNVRGKQEDGLGEVNRVAIDDLKRSMEVRLVDQEKELARLRAELHDTQATISVLQVWVFLSFAIGVIGLGVAIWALVH